MPATSSIELPQYCSDTAKAAKAASYQLASLDTLAKNHWLTESAAALIASTDLILEANQRDLAAADDYGLSDASVDRLRLDSGRISAIAKGLNEIAMLPDPAGELRMDLPDQEACKSEERNRLNIKKVTMSPSMRQASR